MTVTDERVEAPEDTTGEDQKNETQDDSNSGRKREHDFTKYRDFHSELADYINSHPKYTDAGLDPVTPNQVKAVLLLRTDHANTPERQAEREARKARLEEEKKQFEGKTPEQIAAIKQANKAKEAADKAAKKAQEAIERAERLQNAASASGEDLASVVASQQESVPDPEPEKRGRLGRRR